MKKLKQLLASYDFTNIQEYFSMITESVINGQRTQAKEQFKALPKQQQKEFIVLIYGENSDLELSNEDNAMFMTILYLTKQIDKYERLISIYEGKKLEAMKLGQDGIVRQCNLVIDSYKKDLDYNKQLLNN